MSEEKNVDEIGEGDDKIISLAEKMGWNADYDGPEKISAEEYILKGQDVNRQSSKDITSLKSTITRLEDQMKEVATNTGKQVKRAVDQAKQRLLAERDEAIDNADKDKVKAIDKEIEDLNPENKGPPPDIQLDYVEGVKKFTKDHNWFNPEHAEYNHEWRAQAEKIGIAIANRDPSIKAKDLLDETVEKLKELKPEIFAVPTNKPTYVAGVERKGLKKETAWEKLVNDEPEAKEVFDDYVKKGVFKDSDAAREKYAKEVMTG